MWQGADRDWELRHRWKFRYPGTCSQGALRGFIESRWVSGKRSLQRRVFDRVLTRNRIARLGEDGWGVGPNSEEWTGAVRLAPITGHREGRSLDEVRQSKLRGSGQLRAIQDVDGDRGECKRLVADVALTALEIQMNAIAGTPYPIAGVGLPHVRLVVVSWPH